LILQRLFRQPLAVLPDPVRVDRGHAPRRRGRDMREHRQRHIEAANVLTTGYRLAFS